MNEKDIKKQLEFKNKEIYINKLNLDLANNMDVLVLTIDNLLNNIINDSKSRIIELSETFQNTDLINNTLNEFKELYQDYLMKLLDLKKEKIINLFSNIKINLDSISNNNKEIESKLNEYYDKNINSIINNLNNIKDSSFYKKRLNDYLTNNLKSILIYKILDNIKIRDIMLYNTFKESYLKYQELNKNTIK